MFCSVPEANNDGNRATMHDWQTKKKERQKKKERKIGTKERKKRRKIVIQRTRQAYNLLQDLWNQSFLFGGWWWVQIPFGAKAGQII